MINYSSAIYDAIGYLGKALIVFAAYYFGHFWATYQDDQHKKAGTQSSKWWKLISILGAVAIGSAILGSSLGSHTEDADPIYGGGETVVDFQTTQNQKYEYALTMFIVFSVAALYGFYKGGKKDKSS